MKIIALVAGILLLVGTGASIAVVKSTHNHGSDQVIDHAGSVDGNGCHHGAGGYHCH